MEIKTKFNIGDKALTLGSNEVITVFIIGINVSCNGSEQERDYEGRKIPMGTNHVSYKVSKTQLAKILERKERGDFWTIDERGLFSTKAELAASLGLT